MLVHLLVKLHVLHEIHGIGTREALSSGLFSKVGMSPSISRASMASFVSADVAGVSNVLDLGAGVSLVDGCGSAVGLDTEPVSFIEV